MKCPECNGPLKMPRRAQQHVGKCRTCKTPFRATRFEHSVQIERLPKKNVAEAEAMVAGRDAAPAVWVWGFRLLAVGLLAMFVHTVVVEILAAYEEDRLLARSGRTTTAKVYSPYSYLPGPTDALDLTYEYNASGSKFEGTIRSDVLYEEKSFEVRPRGVKVGDGDGEEEGGEEINEPANYAGVLTVTYLPSDPGVHQAGTVPYGDSRKVVKRLAVAFLAAFIGVVLWWFSFRLGRIPEPKAST